MIVIVVCGFRTVSKYLKKDTRTLDDQWKISNNRDTIAIKRNRTLRKVSKSCGDFSGKQPVITVVTNSYITPLKESKTKRINLAMAWINNNKVYGMVPQNWIIDCLKCTSYTAKSWSLSKIQWETGKSNWQQQRKSLTWWKSREVSSRDMRYSHCYFW